MNFSAGPVAAAATGALPPLRGRLLLAYRAAWALLLVSVIVLAGHSLGEARMEPTIAALRLGKTAVLLSVSTILFRRRQSDGVAAMLSLALLLWAITSSFGFAGPAAWPLLLDRLRFLLFAWALLLFPNGEWSPWWTRHVALASAGVCLLGIAEAAGVLATALFLPLAIACVVAAVAALLLRYARLGAGTEKQQLKWVALGLTGGIGLILAARAGAAVMGTGLRVPLAEQALEALFQLGIVVIALGFLVSLLRYRLYDAEAVISRSAAYALLTLSLVATFAGSEALIEMLSERYFGSGIGNVSGAMAAAVAAVLLTPLHGRISGWAERRFQRDLILLKEQLPELLAELSGSSSPGRVGLAALPRIEEAVHAGHSAIVVDGTVVVAHGIAHEAALAWQAAQPPLRTDNRMDSLFPLRLGLRCPFGTMRGWLLLGPRPDGSFYGRDDLDALHAILPPLRQALFAAREREKEKALDSAVQQGMRDALRAIEDRVAALEARLAGQRR